MYKVKIEQGYSAIELEFATAKEAVGFIEESVKNCKKKTTFKFEYVVEGEGGEANES